VRKAPSELRTSLLGPPRTARSVAGSGSHLLFEMRNLHENSALCLVGVGSIWFGHTAGDRLHEFARKVDSQEVIFPMCLLYSRQYLNYEMKSHCVTKNLSSSMLCWMQHNLSKISYAEVCANLHWTVPMGSWLD